MDITLFLTKLWGPVILAMGIGIFANRSYYIKVYREFEKDVFATFLFGIVAITAGVAHILVHNIWGSWLEIIISFLGWAVFVKGMAFIVAPKLVSKTSNFYADKNLIFFSGTLLLMLGILLSLVAYF